MKTILFLSALVLVSCTNEIYTIPIEYGETIIVDDDIIDIQRDIKALKHEMMGIETGCKWEKKTESTCNGKRCVDPIGCLCSTDSVGTYEYLITICSGDKKTVDAYQEEIEVPMFELSPDDLIINLDFDTPHTLEFSNDEGFVAECDWTDGSFDCEGDMNEAAELFFQHFGTLIDQRLQ